MNGILSYAHFKISGNQNELKFNIFIQRISYREHLCDPNLDFYVLRIFMQASQLKIFNNVSINLRLQ